MIRFYALTTCDIITQNGIEMSHGLFKHKPFCHLKCEDQSQPVWFSLPGTFVQWLEKQFFYWWIASKFVQANHKMFETRLPIGFDLNLIQFSHLKYEHRSHPVEIGKYSNAKSMMLNSTCRFAFKIPLLIRWWFHDILFTLFVAFFDFLYTSMYGMSCWCILYIDNLLMSRLKLLDKVRMTWNTRNWL